ncbi:hypothetical protein X777_15835 [Ooceraea biroi]|uniref:Uncharacterized protein n=1 Tax=Ooceraea biroi TaxID=2015173 RepID=A0A026WTB9_OOCBI|nr:hypothetical protein X777_15835 [Ooceraea biroi]
MLARCTHATENTALNYDENDNKDDDDDDDSDSSKLQIIRYESKTTSRESHRHTHARASRWQRRSVVPHVRTRRLSRGAVLEVRKRTTTTHHRLATALLPLSAFPCELRAAAVSLYPPAPLTVTLSHTRVYRARLYVRSRHVVYAVYASTDRSFHRG